MWKKGEKVLSCPKQKWKGKCNEINSIEWKFFLYFIIIKKKST